MKTKNSLLLILILIYLMCMRFTVCFAAVESEAIDIAVSHISNATHIPSTVLTSITKPYIYDFGNEWYIALYYHEPIEALDQMKFDQNKSSFCILFSAYVNKDTGHITDALENQTDSLSERIDKYRGNKLTSKTYAKIVDSWEVIFGPAKYWSYDLFASFQLFYAIRPQTYLIIIDYKEDYPLSDDLPLYVFPDENAIAYQDALEIAKSGLSKAFSIKREELDGVQCSSEYCINHNAAIPFDFSGKYSSEYWVFTFYFDNDECLICQILNDGTAEQYVLSSKTEYISCHMKDDGLLIYR